MASPRYTQVDIKATPYYHYISRCVRRAFLCGKDTASGRNFDHRKTWVVERIASLANAFAPRGCRSTAAAIAAREAARQEGQPAEASAQATAESPMSAPRQPGTAA